MSKSCILKNDFKGYEWQMKIRDRIKELRRVRADLLRPNPKNWRTHPPAQRDALRGVLAEVGYADALLARELPDGTLELIDGHLRAETTPQMEVPVLVLDLTDDEAAKLLVLLDPLAAQAETDKDILPSCSRKSKPKTTRSEACSTSSSPSQRCYLTDLRRRTNQPRRAYRRKSAFPRRIKSSSNAATKPNNKTFTSA